MDEFGPTRLKQELEAIIPELESRRTATCLTPVLGVLHVVAVAASTSDPRDTAGPAGPAVMTVSTYDIQYVTEGQTALATCWVARQGDGEIVNGGWIGHVPQPLRRLRSAPGLKEPSRD